MKGTALAIVIRSILCILILLSIGVTYFVMVVKKDYTIITNPDGPDTSDYFIEDVTE